MNPTRNRDGNRDRGRRALLAAALAALLLGGCDVAVVAVLASRSKSDSSSDSPPAPDLRSKLWLANLSALSAVDLDVERDAIIAAKGVPSTPLWTPIPGGTAATFEIDLAALALAGPFDTVLIQCPKAQPYEIDAFEVLETNDIVKETGTVAGTRSSYFGVHDPASGYPDGLTAASNVTAVGDENAFLFCRFAAAFTRVRVSLWTPTTGPGPGDVEWAALYQDLGDQVVGGAAVNSSNRIHVAFREASTVGVLRFDADGTRIGDGLGNDFVGVELSAASVGNASVAIDAANAVVVGVTRTAGADTGNIRVRKYAADMGSQLWGAPKDFITTGVDRVEWNALAVLSPSNDIVVAGGVDFGVGQGIGHFMRRLLALDGTDLWSVSPPAPPLDAGTSYWTAVATSGPKGIYSTGDLTNVTTLVPYTRRTTDNSQDIPTPGAIVTDWSDPRDDAGNTAGKGNAIGVDSAGNVFVGGYYTRAATGKDMVILRYPPAGAPATVHFGNTLLSGADEIMDLALDADDSLWAVGYETVTSPAQGTNIVLFHVSAAGNLLLKRTVDGLLPGGNDRAVSVVLGSDNGKNYVFVVGEITVAGPETDVVVRKYVR